MRAVTVLGTGRPLRMVRVELKFAGGPCHVMTRGNERRWIVMDDRNPAHRLESPAPALRRLVNRLQETITNDVSAP